MYTYLKGIITEIEPTFVALEINSIGYLIITPNSFRYRIGEETKIYIHHYLREDMDNLYGFASKLERDLFIDLISVSGIGPKSALAILSLGNPEKILLAIDNSDVKFLTQFPGIGPKSAQQIILDLKGKLAKDITVNKEDEVSEALRALGYSVKEINKAVKNLDVNLSVEERIKKALGVLIK